MNNVVMVWDGNTLKIPTEIVGTPQPHQFLSTDLDNLIELSGRICYDSVKLKHSRSSPDYHKHISEVGHLSVQEHANFTVLIPKWKYQSELESQFLRCLLNRPGLFFSTNSSGIKLTINIRTVEEWNKYFKSEISDWLGQQLINIAIDLCPMSMFDRTKNQEQVVELVKPETDEEVWVSFLIYKISRSLSHECVRHGDYTAISQRSTRYVDEHESDWAWHPLIDLWNGDKNSLKEIERQSKKVYKSMVFELEEFLKLKGVDKFTAKKQSRGAARGVLGNALSTELIFSANLAQWKHMIKMRASQHADGEIRILFNEIYDLLKEKFPERFENWLKLPCIDGMGVEIK